MASAQSNPNMAQGKLEDGVDVTQLEDFTSVPAVTLYPPDEELDVAIHLTWRTWMVVLCVQLHLARVCLAD